MAPKGTELCDWQHTGLNLCFWTSEITKLEVDHELQSKTGCYSPRKSKQFGSSASSKTHSPMECTSVTRRPIHWAHRVRDWDTIALCSWSCEGYLLLLTTCFGGISKFHFVSCPEMGLWDHPLSKKSRMPSDVLLPWAACWDRTNRSHHKKIPFYCFVCITKAVEARGHFTSMGMEMGLLLGKQMN